MPTPETRFTRQCTYTPLKRQAASQAPGGAATKMVLLHTILGDGAHLEACLERLHDDATNASLADALRKARSGDPTGAARALRDRDVGELVTFGRAVLKVETRLIEEASEAVHASARGVADRLREAGRGKTSTSSGLSSVLLASTAQPSSASGASDVVGVQSGALRMGSTGSATASILAASASELSPVVWGMLREAISDEAPQAMATLRAGVPLGELRERDPVLGPAVDRLRDELEERLRRIRNRSRQLDAFEELAQVEPVGVLALEKLEYTPIGYELGELVHSVPMVPGETVRLTHREWTRTESTFEKVIIEEVDSFTEEALTEKSELSHSASADRQHQMGFNASATVSATYGPVTIGAAAGFSLSEAEQKSEETSVKRSRELTEKASNRVKREQKFAFRTVAESESENVSFRELTNTTTEPVRWDYHRLMKRWRIALFRFDFRLTYDVVIPEPGSFLLSRYQELEQLRAELAAAAVPDLRADEITRASWMELASTYKVALEPPPAQHHRAQVNAFQSFSRTVAAAADRPVEVPGDYVIEHISVNASHGAGGRIDPLTDLNQARVRNAAAAGSSSFVWTYLYYWTDGDTAPGTTHVLTLEVSASLRPDALRRWQVQCLERILDGARAMRDSLRQRLTRRITQLESELYGQGGLALRKIEKEELMKGVLRWILGPAFAFYPSVLPDLVTDEDTGDLGIYGDGGRIERADAHQALLKHGALARFLHQAIEWENVIYMLYPYFWTDDERWSVKQALQHPDFVHRSFLRAGAARVVLTIRPGFEEDLLAFMESLDTGATLDPSHPYITITEEMRARAETTYPYTPSANELPDEALVATWEEFTPTSALHVQAGVIGGEPGPSDP